MGTELPSGLNRSRNPWSRSVRDLYPALHRLEQRGWLKADWKESETGREAKFYSLTRSGQKQLRAEKDSWVRLTGAVQLIFDEGAQ